jgi:RsiW-degrading membrane proteinase PrsW (M82 family)
LALAIRLSNFGGGLGMLEQKECAIPIHKPNSRELTFFFACGIIISVPITLFIAGLADSLLVGFDEFTATLLSVAIFAPFIEEFSKIFPLYYRHGETQRSIMQLAVVVGLGFGLVEMITYVTLYGIVILPFRIPGLLFHPASTAIAAYGIAKKRPFLYYALAVSLHFLNNFLAVTTKSLPLSPSILIVAATVWIAWSFYNKTTEKFIH